MVPTSPNPGKPSTSTGFFSFGFAVMWNSIAIVIRFVKNAFKR